VSSARERALPALLCALLLAGGCGEEAPAPVASEPGSATQAPAADVAALAPEAAPVPPQAPAPRRGLWVLCQGSQRVLEHPERIPELLETARKLAVTDLFVQVQRQGQAWFDSSHADASPYRKILETTGRDTLRELVSAAHAAGLRVHAWVNVLSVAGNREAPIVRELGRDAVQVDRRGRSLLDYPELEIPPPESETLRMGTPAVWLDPATPGVVEALAATFGELVERYPELDGLHLDYIRYPDVLPFSPGSRFRVGLDFGYGEPARRRFQAETGLEAPFGDGLVNANRWDDWRRDRVTETVARIGEAARLARPGLVLSAAVWAYPERSYLSLFQDWRRWLEEELVAFAVPMLYTLDDRLLRYEVPAYARGIGGERVWIGLGTWLFANSPERAVTQLRIVHAGGAQGDALFSYDAIAEAPGLLAALAQEAARGQ
jgi:uncharacterized lipoprotein YddW (UPF0748 family)